MNAGIEALGDGALLVRLGDGMEANARVQALMRRLQVDRPAWLQDLVPAHACLALFFDVGAFPVDAEPARVVGDWLGRRMRDAADTDDAGVAAARTLEIPVCYGGEFGPDLDDWAAACDLDVGTAIARHAGGEYRVAMIGFAPGFPYLTGLDPALAMPRLATPRARVAAGSIGIGGSQTGIYPGEGPGGWRLLGRTPLRLFDAGRAPPSLLQPGDRVRFVAIDRERFNVLAGCGQ